MIQHDSCVHPNDTETAINLTESREKGNNSSYSYLNYLPIPVKQVLVLPTPAWKFGQHLAVLVHMASTYY